MIKNLNFCKDTRISYCIKQYKNTQKRKEKKRQYKQFPEIRKKEKINLQMP
jgi:hypothetical protein